MTSAPATAPGRSWRPGRRRVLSWTLIGLGAAALLAAVVLAAVVYLIDLPAVRAYVAQAASHALGRPVRYRSLSISLLPLPSIRLRGLEVGEAASSGADPAITVDEGWLGMRFWPLFSGRIEIGELRLEGVHATVIEDPAGRLNVAGVGPLPAPAETTARGGAPPSAGVAPPPIPLGRVTVSESTIRFERRGPRPLRVTFEGVDLAAVTAGRPDEFSLKGEAIAGGMRLSISAGRLGPAGGRPFGDLPVWARVEIRAPDVAPLAADLFRVPSMTGPLAGAVIVEGPLSRLTASGEIWLEQVSMAETRPECPAPTRRRLDLRDVRIALRYSAAGLESAPARATLAGGTVSARLEAPADPAAGVAVRDLSVKDVQLGPVLVDYLCQGAAITGPVDLTGELMFRAADPLRTMAGSGRLRVGPGAVVGGQALTAIVELLRMSGLVGVPSELASPGTGQSSLSFSSITASYRILDGVARTDDLVYTGPGFRVTGAGTYGIGDGRMEMDVTFQQGLNQVQALVTGSAGGRLRIVPTAVHSVDRDDLRRFIDRLLR